MLQRAASNAYSWWAASHIRTKQSKWLDNNLQDMEVKVESILKLIEEDGDSFAQKAEMYYRKRPELINFVEEFYRAYRALAERYDHISGELHKANNTIASVFPDQLQLTMEDEEEFNSPKATTTASSKIQKVLPKVPLRSLTNKEIMGPSIPATPEPKRANLEMDKDQAPGEIDKLQKAILVLQTEKEFIKSSYESSLAKYWDIEKRITEMQHEVCCLQDDYCDTMVIADDEARALMAATALKSCEDALINMQEQHKRSAEEARIESERIKIAKEKLKTLKGEQPPAVSQDVSEDAVEQSSFMMNLTVEPSGLKQERLELQSVCDKIKQNFEKTSDMTVVELAEKIDELVDKVINLEATVSAQTAQIKRLKLESDELHKHLQNLEEEKVTLVDDSKSLSDKLKCVEEELSKLQLLDNCLQDESKKLQVHFTEACHNFHDLSEKLQSTDEMGDAFFQGSNQTEIVHNRSLQGEWSEKEGMKDPIDGSNNLLNELPEEVFHAIHETKLCINDQEPYIHSMETSAPDDFTIVPSEHRGEDEIKMNSYIPDDVTGNLVELEQEDKIQNEDSIPGDSTASLIESGWEDETSKVGHALDIKRKQDNEVRRVDSTHAIENSCVNSEVHVQNVEQNDSLNWQDFFLNGLEDREKLLLAEYTSILRNYKDTKRKLLEAEKRHQEYLFETMAKIRDLKNANAMKDEEIKSLRQKLQFLETSASETSDSYVVECRDFPCQGSESRMKKQASLFSPSFTGYANEQNSQMLNNEQVVCHSVAEANESHEESSTDSPLAKAIELHVPVEPETASAIEEKFRRDIDELLEENLEFWLRFSSSFHQIQKFQTSFQDLRVEISKLKDGKKQEVSTTSSSTSSEDLSLKPEVTPAYQHLRDLQNELSIWLDHNAELRVELQRRFSSLCNIKDEISKVSTNTPGAEEAELTAHQAAKFQGEVLNMQQENNKVADELQAGMDHVNGLQAEIEQLLIKLHQNSELSSSSKNQFQYHIRNLSSRTRIPLRSFLFGVKPKSKKPSIFSCMNPALQKQFSDLTASIPQ